MPNIGELRVTSAGNVFRLERMQGEWRYVRRVSTGTLLGNRLDHWDKDVVYRWHACQWEEGIPLLESDKSEWPHFGVFAPLSAL